MSLYAQFQIGADSYVVPARRVTRILPLVRIRSMPGAPQGVAGALPYGSRLVPAVDLSLLAVGHPATHRLSTRILLVHPFEGESEYHLALIAEKLTDTVRLDERSFVSPGVTIARAPYLGAVATLGKRLLQRIDIDKLLPAEVFAGLYETLEARL